MRYGCRTEPDVPEIDGARVPRASFARTFGPSSNGKTPAFGAGNPGSTPGGPIPPPTGCSPRRTEARPLPPCASEGPGFRFLDDLVAVSHVDSGHP